MTRRPETARSDRRVATSRQRRRMMNGRPMTSQPCQDGRRRGDHATRSAASRVPEEWPTSRRWRGGRSRRRATSRTTTGDAAGCRSASVADAGADAAASRSREVAAAAAANSEDVCDARSRVDVRRSAPRPTRRRPLDVAATYDHPARRRLPLR